MDGKDVLVVSGCNVKQRGNSFKNVNSSVFIVGEIDFVKGAMKVDLIREIDKGDTFYAPQFINGANRPIIVGWLEMWGKRYPTHEWGHGWTGAFSVPREISIAGGEILQKPVKELDGYLTPAYGDAAPACADIRLEFDGEGSVTLAAENGEVIIGNNGGVYLDTTNSNNLNGCVRKTDFCGAHCQVRVLLDVSSIEVFVRGGREVISSRIYLDGGYTLKTQGAVKVKSIAEIGAKL